MFACGFRSRILRLLLSSGLLTMACSSSPVEPPFQTVVVDIGPLQLDSFHTVLQDSGIVVVSSRLADTLGTIEEKQLIAATLTTSRGDSESFYLGRDVCGSGGVFHLCRGLVVSMRGSAQVRSLFARLDALPARLTLVSVSGRVGGVRVLGDLLTSTATSLIQAMPEVEGVSLDGVGSPGGGSSAFRYLLSGAIALDFGAPRPHDGRVQAVSADTVIIVGVGSSGSTIVLSIVVP